MITVNPDGTISMDTIEERSAYFAVLKREAHRKKRRAYYARNRERILAYHKQWVAKQKATTAPPPQRG